MCTLKDLLRAGSLSKERNDLYVDYCVGYNSNTSMIQNKCLRKHPSLETCYELLSLPLLPPLDFEAFPGALTRPLSTPPLPPLLKPFLSRNWNDAECSYSDMNEIK